MPVITAQTGQGVQPTEEVGSVPVSLDLFKGEQAAKKELIGTVEKESWSLIKLQETEQENSAKMDYEARYRNFITELNRDTDYASHKTKFEAWHQKNSAEILGKVSNVRARKSASDFLRLHQIRDGLGVEVRAWDNRAAEIGQKIPTEIDNHITTIINRKGPEKDEAIADMDKYLAGLRESGLLDGKGHEFWKRESTEQLVKAEKEYTAKLAEDYINNQVIDIAIAAEAEQEGSGWEASIRWLNDPSTAKQLSKDLDMNLSDIDAVIEDLKTQASLRNADEQVRLAKAQEQQKAEVWDRISKQKFEKIEEFIAAQPDLSTEQRIQLSDKAMQRADAINRGKEDPFTKSEGAVYFKLRRKIALDPRSVSEADLAKRVGDGLSITDYEKLLKMTTDTGDPLNRPNVKRAQKVIDDTRRLDVRLADDDVNAALLAEEQALENQQRLDDWVIQNADNPNFDLLLRKETSELLREPIEKVTLNGLEKLLSPKKVGGVPFVSAFFDIFLRSESQELAQERRQSMRKESRYKNLSDEKKDIAKELVEGGSTVKNAIETAELPLITTVEQHSKLKKGTRYINSEGKVSVKK